VTLDDQAGAGPFVGPRPYEIGERLFGRDREVLQLLDLLIAERIVLLYSPSGAGKTSLVQAGLVPALRKEDFAVPGVARVKFDSGAGLSEPAANRYVFAVLLSLEEDQPHDQQFPLPDLARMSLSDYLDRRWADAAQTGGVVLILDQFEEILTIDPTDLSAQNEFFAQLGAALRDPHRWALLSMREEYVAGLDPYRNLIPTRLASTFRLELLNEQQARQAMQEASAQAGVEFTDGAARKLADDLRKVRVQRPGGSVEEQLGPSVEPTQLQVVCLRLWSNRADKARIAERDVEALGSVDTALADYYARVVAKLESRERVVRDWIEDKLITPQGLRNQILMEEALQSEDLGADAITLLDGQHLVRQERRRGISWLELAHDRLVQPIRANNAAWRDSHLSVFQRQAAIWDKERRSSRLELHGPALRDAKRWAKEHDNELTPTERDFLNASLRSRRAAYARIFTIIALGFGIFAAVSVNSYLRWLDDRPWGHLTNLKSGESHELAGDLVSVSRPQPGFEELVRSQISLRPNIVSRWQLMVSRYRRAFDVRSLNGTVINGRFLQYGYYRDLVDGDLITVAGYAPFRFSAIEPYYVPLLARPAPKVAAPAEGQWAILLDGVQRTIVSLYASELYLARDENGNLSLSESRDNGSLLKITKSDDLLQFRIETLDTNDAYYLFAMFKYEDRTYVAAGIPRGRRVHDVLRAPGKQLSGTEYASKMSFCFGPASQAQPDKLDGVQMQQLVRIDPEEADDQPRCTLGPFQIVDLRQSDEAGGSSEEQ
jgi:hypothetical protein